MLKENEFCDFSYIFENVFMASLLKTEMYTETHHVKDVLSCHGSAEAGGTGDIKETGATIYTVYLSCAPDCIGGLTLPHACQAST